MHSQDSLSSWIQPSKSFYITESFQELKAFSKVDLKPGETEKITFELDQSARSFYDVNTNRWIVEPGEFEVLIGSSSRDLRLNATFEVMVHI